MRASITLLAAAVLLPACTTMKAVESPVTFLEQNNPRHVRVYTADGEFYVLRDPQLRSGAISGFDAVEQEELSLPVNGIRRMEALQPDKTRTALFIGAMTIIGGAGIYMISKAADGRGLICDNYQVDQRCVPAPAVSSGTLLTIPLRF